MERDSSLKLDLNLVPTPCFVLDESRLMKNLMILSDVQEQTGAKILLALKGFAMFSVFPMIRKTLYGVCASSPHEAMLGREAFGREVHAHAAAFSESDIDDIIKVSDHITFNSFSQFLKFKDRVLNAEKPIELGIRVNPEHSETGVEIYDPCRKGSRLGVCLSQFREDLLEDISGMLFHTLCEKDADALERTLLAFEHSFGEFIPRMRWINFGGGHHITRDGYQVDLLCDLIKNFREKYRVDVYLEPGEAVALNAGFLVASVLDIIHNEKDIAILDTSAATHMPDILEMPYRPDIIGSGAPGEKKYTYHLGGPSCLAGDVIGDYSFSKPLLVGQKLIFTDMAHYTMVKTNTFNGIGLPSIAIFNADLNRFKIIRQFGYEDYKSRLS